MPKTPKFAYRSTPRGWLVNVPASLTATDKRERVYHPSRDAAKAHAATLRKQFQEQGASLATIKPSLAEDATRATLLLEPYGVSLAQAAKFYATHHDKRAKAPTLAVAWADGLVHRKNHRARTKADFRAWEKALPGWLMKMNCHDITDKDLSKALHEVTDGATRWKNGLRNLSAILGDVVKAGLIEKNPAAKVRVARAEEKDDEVTIYTPKELQAIFDACVDYPLPEKDRLCSGCTIPFALMAFAGVRPDEVTKLRWDDISLELHNVCIGSSIAKKMTRRNIRIHPTLAAWLSTVPKDERKGRVVPARWRYKAAKVRIKAGICGREMQDALRHSYGTYMLAIENDLDALNSDMGHAHMGVFFQHYYKAVTKAEAIPYFQILPSGMVAAKMEVVA